MHKEELSAQDYAKKNRRRRVWHRIVSALGCVVMFCTTYALILPAITMERDCGVEEHIHDDSCYTQIVSVDEAALGCAFVPHVHTQECGESCGYADYIVHSHNDCCFDGDCMICVLEEIEAHTHSDTCYQAAHTHSDDCYETNLGMLTCVEEEGENHTHGEECYVRLRTLTCEEDTDALVLACGKDEILLHTHIEECFNEEHTLICGQTEVQQHDHTADCVVTVSTPVDTESLTCTLAEDENHTHGSRCYGTWELSCGLAEHTHTEECRTAGETEAEETEATEETEAEEELAEEGDYSIGFFSYRPYEVIDGGTFTSIEGNEMTWQVTKDTLTGEYTLTIDGEGQMPDFTSVASTIPWYAYIATHCHVVIGDEVTRIGAWAFGSFRMRSIQWGGVETIARNAFAYGHPTYPVAGTLEIPGTVKRIESGAFYCCNLADLKLNEGTEYIGNQILFNYNYKGTTPMYIPSTVTTIEGTVSAIALSYEVAEDNPNYCSIDGVLYTKDKKKLLDYPAYKEAEEFRVPDHVEVIGNMALADVKAVKKLYVPATVKSTTTTRFLQNSNYEEVYFEDGFYPTSTSLMLLYSPSIRSLRLPENTPIAVGDFFYGGTFSDLTSYTYPNGTTKVHKVGNGSTVYLPALEKVLYDAADAAIDNARLLGYSGVYDLTIGKNVDKLPANFTHLAQYAGSWLFEPENTITAEAGAFAGCPAPIIRLEGLLYVDAQGVVYMCDEQTQSAAVAYCPPGLTEITVPDSVTPDDGVSYAVTSVKWNALALAEDLQSVTFADPAAITALETYALANCPTLTCVNGETTVEDAAATFPNAVTAGIHLFDNTGLTNAPQDALNGAEELNVTSDTVAALTVSVNDSENVAQWVSGDSGGEYRLLTGQTIDILASVGNVEGTTESKYRIYLRASDVDFTVEDQTLQEVPGYAPAIQGISVTYHETEDPGTVYAEFTVPVGGSAGIPVSCVYPNGTTDGGSLTVWGMIDDGTLPADRVVESDDVIRLVWRTEADDFAVTKAPTSTGVLGVVGEDGAVAHPSDNLAWKIVLSRATERNSSAGKDYAKRADFVDILTLPAGVVWADGVQTALENGDVSLSSNTLYLGDLKLASFSISGTNVSLHSQNAVWKDGNVALSWSVTNKLTSGEMNTATVTVTFSRNALKIDTDTYKVADRVSFVNDVYTTVHYTYQDDVDWEENTDLHATATRDITGGTANFKYKLEATTPGYFGDDITYTGTLYNEGAFPATGSVVSDTASYTLDNILEKTLYISPDNMEKMFGEHSDLTVTITGAVLGSGQEEVTGVDGTTALKYLGNSDDINGYSTGNTLTVTFSESGYTVTVTDSEGSTTSYTANTVAGALAQAGYTVTNSAVYSCSWPVNEPGTTFVLNGGGSVVRYTYATVKNTFQMTDSDWLRMYNGGNSVPVKAKMYFTDPDGKNAGSRNVSQSVKRDAEIVKTLYKDGVETDPSSAMNDGDVLDYKITFSHYGEGTMEDVPFVDDLCGSQYLLVPVEKNPALADLGLETCTDDEAAYYILTEGSYQNITVGIDDEGTDLIAATITVDRKETEENFVMEGNTFTYTGIHTEIKWYFPELSGGFYSKDINYKAIVDLDLTGVSYTIGNVVTVNDRAGTEENSVGGRIYNTLWGNCTLFSYDLSIVTDRGTTAASDVLEEHTLVSPGEQVVYRAQVGRSNVTNAVTVNGTKLAVALPDTFDLFEWKIGENVTDIQIVVGENVYAVNPDSYYLGTEYGETEGQQFILWPEETEFTFNDTDNIYIYYTLTYPTNEEDALQGAGTYAQFADVLLGSPFYTDFYMYRYSDSVSHDVVESGRALLQKGVYGMYHHVLGNSTNDVKLMDTRSNFSNSDSRTREAGYYVVIYNGGNKRLYLSDLYDELPDGFTFTKVITNGGSVSAAVTTSVTTKAEGVLTDVSSDSVKFVSATVTADTTDDGLKFKITAGSSTASNTVHYDETLGQYYLEKNEAIEFGYLCSIGTAEATGDRATNTVTMAYTDHTGTGMTVISESELSVAADMLEGVPDQNDGPRFSLTGEQILQDYGFSGTAEQWLVSNVTLQKGGIIPGITKEFRGTDADAGSLAATRLDTIVWGVRLYNSGTLTMTDYTMVDTLPKPYTFAGDVSYTLCDGADFTSAEVKLIGIEEHTTADGQVVITDYQYNSTKRTVTIGGAEVACGKNGCESYVSLYLDENGAEVLKIRFVGVKHSIFEGGYMDLVLRSSNETDVYTYSVFTNQALLYPSEEQKFSAVTQGSKIQDEDNNVIGAKNTAFVTITSGYATSSDKIVTETNDSNNSTSATGKDYIVLPDEDSRDIQYTLTVNNDNDVNMTKLVLIDSLPQIGDHNPFDAAAGRGSAYKVSFAQDPAVQVVVKDPDGNQITEGFSWTVEFSEQTDFGGPQTGHWTGTDTTGWTSEATASSRSMRIIITGVIPADATVDVTFAAQIEEGAEAGQTAWNNFGYHYAVEGSTIELEAMSRTVGTVIPSVPKLQKKLVDTSGVTVAAPEAYSFSFLVYQGEALTGEYAAADEFKAALDAESRVYKEVTLTVEADASESEQIKLEWDDFVWSDGKTYTVTEVTPGWPYSFRRFYGTTASSYTFTYDPVVSQEITCENTRNSWSVVITKVDGNGEETKLAGAVFALYSPDETDKSNDVPAGFQEQIDNWYFVTSCTTGDDGKITLEDLKRDSYYLLEVTPPDGYMLPDDPGQVIYRNQAEQCKLEKTLVNYPGYELPATGGMGTTQYTIGGTLLMMAAGILLVYQQKARRGKEENASS